MTRIERASKLGICAAALLLAGLAGHAQAPTPIAAQAPTNLVFTVGTTITDGSAHPWSYVRLGAVDPRSLAGKSFQVYGKTGFPTNAGTFTLRGTVFQQTDSTAINNLLSQSLVLNEDLTSLSNALNIVLTNRVPGVYSMPLAQKILASFAVGAADSSIGSTLTLLSAAHPGLTMCQGQAFSEQISATTTYEIRDVNPATGAAGDVVGRVTIVPGAELVLPAPGAPFQAVTNEPADNLLIRLRWSRPDALRRVSLFQYGYNVWRITNTVAIANGWHTNPPTRAVLGNGLFTRVNLSPVLTSRDLADGTGAGQVADPADRTTAFFTDNNGRSWGGISTYTNTPPAGYSIPPFNDGQQFYYFLTARDLLGRDGLVSTGGLATAWRRLTPPAPSNVRVEDAAQTVTTVNSTNVQQRFRVTWDLNTNAYDQVSEYWIYRWPNPALALTNDATPYSNRVGVVGNLGPTNFLDQSADAPTVPGSNTFWYTVRAVSQAAAGPLFSTHSAPAWGVLRVRSAPDAPTGGVIGSCGTPVVMFQNFASLPNPAGGDTVNWNFRLTCQRRDAGIAWVQFTVSNSLASIETIGPIYFDPTEDTVSRDYPLATGYFGSGVGITCVVGTFFDKVSAPVMVTNTAAIASDQIRQAVFVAGELAYTALDSADPLLAAYSGGQSVCHDAATAVADPSGMVRMEFDFPRGTPVFVRYANNGLLTDIGVVTPDTNRFYWVDFPACLIGPLPKFQGCSVLLTNDGDCPVHIPAIRAVGNAAGRSVPIRVFFRTTIGTHEYRLYRSVNEGPLTLLSAGPVLHNPLSPARTVFRTDDVPPKVSSRVCYFAQMLDEHGNGSPLSLLGCKDTLALPRPVLSQPVVAGDANTPQVTLNWSCPTSGVYRFEVKIAAPPPAGVNTSRLAHISFPFNTNPVTPQTMQVLPHPNTNASYLGLQTHRALPLHFDESQVTPPVGPDFGPGPQFALTAQLRSGVQYTISVSAQDSRGHSGAPSAAWSFTWKPPTTPIQVPWPARPWPQVNGFDEPAPAGYVSGAPRVSAVVFTNGTGGLFDTHYPVGIRFAQIIAPFITPNIGSNSFASYSVPSGQSVPATLADPNNSVFLRLSNFPERRGNPLLPIVVYRQQVTNAAFSRVSGNLAQVTPLLERVPWTYPAVSDSFSVIIPDPLIALGREVFSQSAGGTSFGANFLYLRDQQPVISGARYRYFVARMDDKREIAEVIPAGEVDIP